jgi:L-ascorbate metabolism protein UlaG (beta-lactamase superfamily)
MALFGRLYPMDVALLPIGGVFTMDAYQAAEAANLLRPKTIVPIHYASFPIIAKTADEFIHLCGERAPDVKVAAIKPGENLNL